MTPDRSSRDSENQLISMVKMDDSMRYGFLSNADDVQSFSRICMNYRNDAKDKVGHQLGFTLG